MDEMLNGIEHMNFFEGRATEYAKASTEGTWMKLCLSVKAEWLLLEKGAAAPFFMPHCVLSFQLMEAHMIELYTSPTPNGYKASVTLEELDMDYNVHVINLQKTSRKHPDFGDDPNGRIPVIVDPDFDNLAIFETGAIMVHLAEKAGRLRRVMLKGAPM